MIDPIGAWDATGQTDTRFEDIAGTNESTTKVGRLTNLIEGGVDLYAPDSTRRFDAEEGYASGDATTLGGLITDTFTAISQPIYFAIRFREEGFVTAGNHLLNAIINGSQELVATEKGSGEFYALDLSNPEITEVTTTSGDHTLEVLIGGTVDKYALDGEAWVNSAVSKIGGDLTRISVSHDYSGALDSTGKRWRGRFYRLYALKSEPTESERQSVRDWVEGDSKLPGVPTDEEIFQASFEDASGRDPLPTALLERTPARQLANHLVNVYRFPPYIVTKRFPIDLDQYPLTEPGLMMWHQDDDDPLFSMGRWAQIQGRRFEDNPVAVELRLRISDHPESFEKPT